MIPLFIVSVLSVSALPVEYSAAQCEFLETLQTNITQLRNEGYKREFVLEHTISEDGESSSAEDQLYIEEAVNRVYDGEVDEQICAPK